MADQKTMQTSCLGDISGRWESNFYLLPQEIGFFGPKTAKFGPTLTFLAKYRHFWPIWSHGQQFSFSKYLNGTRHGPVMTNAILDFHFFKFSLKGGGHGQWSSGTFDLLFFMIIDSKRSIDR